MKPQTERATCSKAGCGRKCVMQMIVHTEDGPVVIDFCPDHMLTASRLIDALVQELIARPNE